MYVLVSCIQGQRNKLVRSRCRSSWDLLVFIHFFKILLYKKNKIWYTYKKFMQISIDLPKVKVKKSSAAPSLNIYKYNLYLFYGMVSFIDVETDCNVRLIYWTQQSIVILYFIIISHCCNWNKKTASSKV